MKTKRVLLLGIAMACHEVNRAYCQALGDLSQPAWADAPDWQKDSAMLGVELHAGNPDAGPQASHESWMAQKLADGWVYGEVKDPGAKTHPCLVPFADLPVDQQAKDFIFRAVVHSMLSAHEQLDGALAHGELATGFGLDPLESAITNTAQAATDSKGAPRLILQDHLRSLCETQRAKLSA
jgi:hypothetical protein